MTNRPSDRALWTSVIETLRESVLAHVAEPYAALQTRRLIGLATYARDRGADPSSGRTSAITELIGTDDPTAVLVDVDDPRRVALQHLLMDHLDSDLSSERVLLDHFDERPELGTAVPPTSGIDDHSIESADDDA